MTKNDYLNKFRTRNYETWEFKVQNKFEDEGLAVYITGTPVQPTIISRQPATSPATGTVETEITNPAYAAWAEGDAKTRRRIVEMVDDDQVAYIRDAKTAAQMWENLRAIYQRTGMQSMIAINEKLSNIKYAGIESGPLQDHLDIILRHASDLRRGNDPLSDGFVQSVSILATTHTTLQSITPLLLEEEGRQRAILESAKLAEHALKAHTEKLAFAKAHDEEVAANAVKAFVAQGSRGSWRGRGGGGGERGNGGNDWKKTVTCYGCGNKGHIQRDCLLSKKDAAKERLRLAQVAYNAIADDDHPKVLLTKKTTNALRSDALFVDSGASRHLTSDRASFINFTVLKKPIPIQLGDNSEIYATGCGTRRTCVKTPLGTRKMDFTRTLYAPKLAGSLLSVGQLTAIPGVKMEFEGTLCLIKLHGETLCQASFRDGLYTLDLVDAAPSTASVATALKAKTPKPAGNLLLAIWLMVWRSGLRGMISRVTHACEERHLASHFQKADGDVLLVF